MSQMKQEGIFNDKTLTSEHKKQKKVFNPLSKFDKKRCHKQENSFTSFSKSQLKAP